MWQSTGSQPSCLVVILAESRLRNTDGVYDTATSPDGNNEGQIQVVGTV